MVKRFIAWLKEPFLKADKSGDMDWFVITAMAFLVILIMVILTIMTNIP